MSVNYGKYEVATNDLYKSCDMSLFKFRSTLDIKDEISVMGQQRAIDALGFGIGIQHDGYNLYVAGSTGLGKHETVKRMLEEKVSDTSPPPDWCYINNFDRPHQPVALNLPTGNARRLKEDMQQLIEDLLIAIPASFESDEYRSRAHAIRDEFKNREENAFTEIGEKAASKNIALIKTPGGYTIGPMREGEILTPEEFEKLAEDEQEEIKITTGEIEEELREIIRKIPLWSKETRRKINQLNREISKITVDEFISDIIKDYSEFPEVLKFLGDAKNAIIDDVELFRESGGIEVTSEQRKEIMGMFTKYQVNVLVDNTGLEGTPIIYEDNPTYNNLIGRVEHRAQYGTLTTDFTLIKPGALHRANGGYLVLDARKVLLSLYAWDALKRALHAHEVKIESIEQVLSIVSTISLEPEPIPINVKVILTGDRLMYYLLKEYDPDFGQLFKVIADFSEDTTRSDDSVLTYASMIAAIQRQADIRPIDKDGIARIIEDCARKVEDSERLSLHMGNLTDLLKESDFWADSAGKDIIGRPEVQKAIDMRIERLAQYRDRMQEEILRDVILVETDGTETGQVNGLSIIQLGDNLFGRPFRITATARLGTGKVIDIEREVKLGGAIHSKGVLILSSYLANRYASDQVLSLAASLVFEQSYGQVEGDSASVAELCALISALTRIPVKQSLAVTGSVNQMGQVQAIGGVNEKIEGFFDICKARGLNKLHGVIIPASNIKHLMLRRDVVDAVEDGKFHIYSAAHIDEVMELLTDLPAGKADKNGKYEDGTINSLVMSRIESMNQKRISFMKSLDETDERKD
jgi:lon-related putative ATP-dependent protease